MERILKFVRRLSAIRGPPAINYAIERVKLCSEARNMVARLNRVVEIAFDERVRRRTNVDLDIVDSFDKRFSRRVVEDHARFFASASSSRDARASRTNPESIKSRVPSFLVAKFFAWGIARARRQGRERRGGP